MPYYIPLQIGGVEVPFYSSGGTWTGRGASGHTSGPGVCYACWSSGWSPSNPHPDADTADVASWPEAVRSPETPSQSEISRATPAGPSFRGLDDLTAGGGSLGVRTGKTARSSPYTYTREGSRLYPVYEDRIGDADGSMKAIEGTTALLLEWPTEKSARPGERVPGTSALDTTEGVSDESTGGLLKRKWGRFTGKGHQDGPAEGSLSKSPRLAV